MAKGVNSNPAPYGKGLSQSNPFFPFETHYQGPTKTISSPHGSQFEVGGIHTGGPFERLNKLGPGLPGKGRK